MPQNWKMITKICVDCETPFLRKSTSRSRVRCGDCRRKRRRRKARAYYFSKKLGDVARKNKKPCELCGAPGRDYHHIVRLADGGSAGAENLMFLCKPCHRKQHASKK